MKHVVITGCTRGLGLAMARSFASRGWRVSGCGTDRNLVDSLGSELGEPHCIRLCDVTDSAAVEAFSAEVIATNGPPDLLLNNAARVNRNAPLWEVPAEEFASVIDVNLKGVFLMCRAFVPAMIERKSGVIVNFSSGWGRSTSPDVAPYCATKWGVEGLTRGLAQELPAGLAAVPLNPGIIDTDMLRSSFGPDAAHYPSPADWAEKAVPFLEKIGAQDNGHPLTAPN